MAVRPRSGCAAGPRDKRRRHRLGFVRDAEHSDAQLRDDQRAAGPGREAIPNYPYQYAWHTTNDLYSELVPYTEHQQHSALATAVVAYGVANLSKPLTRDGVYLADGIASPGPVIFRRNACQLPISVID